jgi:hypothetical protein
VSEQETDEALIPLNVQSPLPLASAGENVSLAMSDVIENVPVGVTGVPFVSSSVTVT